MLELPRNRIRLRRKARGDNLVPFSRDTSSRDASAGADGRRLTMRRTIFMVAVQAPRAGERLNQSRGVGINCLVDVIEGRSFLLDSNVGELTRSISISFSIN